MGKVLAIGLDAASVPLMERLVDEGRLPHLQRLRDRSARWAIDAGPAALRNLQWSQFNFGTRMEGDRGNMFVFDPEGYRCRIRDARHEHHGRRQFWDREDLRTLVFDVPESAVVDTATAITAWGTHAALFPRSSHPVGLLDEIDRVVGVHPAYGNDFDAAWHDRRAIDVLADALEAGAERRARAFRLVDARSDWDLAVVVMSEMHSAGHFWWHAVEPEHPLRTTPHCDVARTRLEDVYAAVDRAVGELVSVAPADATVVVFSHDDMRFGHGDVPTIALLPELLHRHELGVPLLRDVDAAAWRAAGCPPVVPAPGMVWRAHMDSLLVRPRRSLRRRLHQLGAYRWAKQTRAGRRAISALKGRPIGAVGIPIPPETTEGVLDRDRLVEPDTNEILFTEHYQPSWSRMRAFALPTFNAGAVRINLVGRERAGVVDAADYDSVCDEIEALVTACTDPRTGAPVVAEVERPRRADPFDPEGDVADLVFRWQPRTMLDAFDHPEHGLIGPVPVHRPGVHDAAGFLYVATDDLAPGDRGTRSACDIPVTLLHLAGVDADDLDGCSVIEPELTRP